MGLFLLVTQGNAIVDIEGIWSIGYNSPLLIMLIFLQWIISLKKLQESVTNSPHPIYQHWYEILHLRLVPLLLLLPPPPPPLKYFHFGPDPCPFVPSFLWVAVRSVITWSEVSLNTLLYIGAWLHCVWRVDIDGVHPAAAAAAAARGRQRDFPFTATMPSQAEHTGALRDILHSSGQNNNDNVLN